MSNTTSTKPEEDSTKRSSTDEEEQAIGVKVGISGGSTEETKKKIEKEGGDKGDNITDKLVKTVHPKLAEMPNKCKALSIAVFVMVAVFVFVVIMTLYSFIVSCEQKLLMIDADWQPLMESEDGSDIHPFEPYSGTFEAPAHICASYAPLDIYEDENYTTLVQTVYIVPCLLGELTCEDYGGPSCPNVFQTDGSHYQCGSNDTLRNCHDYSDPLVSVVYVECVGFFGAFGIALAYLVYIQLAALLLGYCFYRCCCSVNDYPPNTMFQDMQEFVMTSRLI